MTACSVVMPLYNAEAYVVEAAESILAQSFGDFELLVVNDGSTDASEMIVRDLCRRDSRVKLVQNTGPKGAVGALNTGLDLATGTYVARMDADDISLPARLERQHEFLEAHPEVSVCGTNMELFGAQAYVWRLPQDHETIRAGLLFTVLIAHATVMIRRSALEDRHFRYDADFRYAEDYELWSRLSEHYRFANIPDVLYRYRRYGQGDVGNRERIRVESAQRVRRRLLGGLGITPSADEDALHREIGDYSYAATTGFVHRADLWLDRIVDANARSQVFDDRALRSLVNERKAEIRAAELARNAPVRLLDRLREALWPAVR